MPSSPRASRLLRWSGRDAVLAALLLGAGVPVAKWILDHPDMGPATLSGLLYGSAGVMVLFLRLFFSGMRPEKRSGLRRRELLRTLLVSIIGGVIAPLAMYAGLRHLSAAAGSLLLNVEGIFNIVLAAIVLGEPLGARSIGAAALTIGGAVLLGASAGRVEGSLPGFFLVALAALSWSIESLLSRSLSERDSVGMVMAKGLIAGPICLLVGRLRGEPIPSLAPSVVALLAGVVLYSGGLILLARALRKIGVARSGSIIAAAPCIGALLAWPLLGERPSAVLLVALGAMAAGVLLLYGEQFHRHRAPAPPLEDPA